jgi:predicted CoA-binding protein
MEGSMAQVPEPIAAFLLGKRIAVAGVSRSPSQPANAIYRRLQKTGYEVFPINPNATTVEGATCYPTLEAVPGPVDGVVIATHPAVAADVVSQCASCGIRQLWFHRSFGSGSVSDEALKACADRGLEPIVGGCPMMFCEPVDFGHKCMRWWLQRRGRVPN